MINKIDGQLQINSKNSYATFEANENKSIDSSRLTNVNDQIFELERNISEFNRNYKNLLIKLNVKVLI